MWNGYELGLEWVQLLKRSRAKKKKQTNKQKKIKFWGRYISSGYWITGGLMTRASVAHLKAVLKMRIIATFLVTCILGQIDIVSCAPPSRAVQAPIALHIVAMQWPYTFCRTKPCVTSKLRQYFTLHGVWPTLANGSPKTNCPKGQNFSLVDIQNLTPKLKSIWPSFTNLSDEDFWEYEWNKHGSCSSLSLKTYFQESERIGNQASQDISTALTKSSITPSASQSSHTVLKYHDAIDKAIHSKPIIRCITSQGKYYLLEIRLCIDLRFKYQHCTQQSRFQGCGDLRYINNTILEFPDN